MPIRTPSSPLLPPLALALGAATAMALAACSDEDSSAAKGGGDAGAGGESSAGGAGTGGSDPSTGGAPGAGGSAAAGGAPGDAGPEGGGVPVDVTIDDGPLRGSTVDGVSSFLGIPYAATTGGQNRWRAPQPVTPWTSVRDATAFGKLCPQITPASTSYDPNADEDCLFVNVWTPDVAPGTPLPVMVWIHGGAFIFGSGGPPYEGAHLARTQNVVLVTLNYRLGALGFMAHPDLSAETTPASSGAYGIQDQVKALEWVRDNVGAFGGDPGQVTIFGESAGGRSVCFHLLSPGSRGLFHRAIVESGFCMMQSDSLASGEALGERFADLVGCDNPAEALSCLRALPPSDLIKPAEATSPGGLFYQARDGRPFFQPVVDGVTIPDQPDALFAAGDIADVPVIQGATTAEGALFHVGLFLDTPPANEAEYTAAVGRRFPDHVSDIAAEYPVADFDSPNAALEAVSSDAFFVCAARRVARALAAAGVTNYLYSFDGPLDPALLPGLTGRAFHSADIPYVFGNSFVLGTIPAAYADLATSVQGYWARFAKTGDPNGGTAVAWPAYTTAEDPNLNLANPVTAGTGLKSDRCDFWDPIPLTL